MDISVIIPTWNEAGNIGQLVHALRRNQLHHAVQIIVADGGSSDNTLQEALLAGADLAVVSPRPGRAHQMNYGASLATADILYFIHADVQPHPAYGIDILQAVAAGASLGCYRLSFHSGSLLLKINAFFTRLPFLWCRGGDQSLFITRQAFERLGAYPPVEIMEEYELLQKAHAQQLPFTIIPKPVVASARKYQENPYFRVQYANFRVMRAWKKRTMDHQTLAAWYRKLLKHR